MVDQPTPEQLSLIDKIAAQQALKNARNQHEFDDHYQSICERLLNELPRHEPHKGNLEGYLRFHALMANKKTLELPVSMSRDKQQRYRKLLGTEVTYDGFIHAAEAVGEHKADANVVWLNANPYQQSWGDQDGEWADFLDDSLAMSGSTVEDQVINANTLGEIMAIFADRCEPRVHQVWTLVNQLEHYSYEDIGQLLDPPISKATVSRDYKKAEAALYALGQLYSVGYDFDADTA